MSERTRTRTPVLPRLALLVLAAACVDPDDELDATSGATDTGDHGTDGDCTGEAWAGSATVSSPADLADLAGYEEIDGELHITGCEGCGDLEELICLERVAVLLVYENDDLERVDGLSNVDEVVTVDISDNAALRHVNGLSALGWVEAVDLSLRRNPSLENLDGLLGLEGTLSLLTVVDNPALPDCEVCDLLEQLDAEPDQLEVHGNLEDPCTPVPASCP